MGTLSEHASKELLKPYGVPFLDERSATDGEAALAAAHDVGLPVVLKLNGDRIAHKTERGLVRLGLASDDQIVTAATELLGAATPADGDVTLLVAPMVASNREFICGASTDPQFGPTVLLGVGGILAEAIADVAIRLAPITSVDAEEMIDQLQTQDLLGPFRGEKAIDRDGLVATLLALSDAITDDPGIVSIDLNPVLVHDGAPIAVDALVEVGAETAGAAS